MAQDTQAASLTASEGESPKPISLSSLFFVFLKAGCLGFGGFMSLISVVESIIVKKKKLMTEEEMLDGISLANLLPGPQAVNVVAYSGNKLKGTRGAIIAVIAVVLPSFILMTLLSYLYSEFGQFEEVKKFFRGFLPAVAAVIISVVWRMAKQTVKGTREIILVLISTLSLFVAAYGLFGIPKIFQLYITFAIVLLFGIAGYFLFHTPKPLMPNVLDRPKDASTNRGKFPFVKVGLAVAFAIVLIVIGLSHPALNPNSNLNLMTTFSGLSVMLFGGGYVIIPMMANTVVDNLHWLTKDEFNVCIAFSQIMPGPILIASAFIGFHVQSNLSGQILPGILGAFLSTVAIFAPPAILMVVASQALDYFKKSAAAKAVMKGIRCGVIGMILIAVYIILSTQASKGGIDWHNFAEVWPTVLIFAGALVALVRFNVDVVYIIPTAGLIGFFLYP